MKRKEIQEKINQADARLTREKATIYLNVINSIFEVSDKERLHFFDTLFLYVFYGEEPDFGTFSKQKRGQIVLLFDLLKRQRTGFENTLKSSNYDNLPPKATPEATPDKDLRLKNKDINIKTKDEDEDKDKDTTRPSAVSSSSSVERFIEVFQSYVARGRLQGYFDGTLSEWEKKKIDDLSATIDDFAGKFWEEVNVTPWLQENASFQMALKKAEDVVSGKYRRWNKPNTMPGTHAQRSPFGPPDETTLRIAWEACSEEGRKEYLDTHGGKYPWEDELYLPKPEPDQVLKKKYEEHPEWKAFEDHLASLGYRTKRDAPNGFLHAYNNNVEISFEDLNKIHSEWENNLQRQ